MRKHLATLGFVLLLGILGTAPVAAGGASVDRVENFGSTVAVRFEEDFPVHSIMRTWCASLLRVERPDGAATETLSCVLTDEPTMIPLFQGVPPTQAFVLDLGPCVFKSDYFVDELVFASSAHIVVTPSGQVHVTSHYPAEPLVCEE